MNDHICFLAANLYALMKTSYLPDWKSSSSVQRFMTSSLRPYMAPAICPAIEPTVSQSPPMSALVTATSRKDFAWQTVWRAIASASMQQEPMYPGCCLSLQGEQVWLGSFQFQFLSSSDLLNFLNFRLAFTSCSQISGVSCWLLARHLTLSFFVWNSLQIFSRSCLGSSSSLRWMSPTMMLAMSLQHSCASLPLCVVRLCSPEYSTAFSRSSLQATGTGASRMSEPLPLLKPSPGSVKSSCFSRYSSMEMEMFPPRPMERFLPPLSRPWQSQSVNMWRMCLGLKRQLLRKMLSAMQRPIEASSVHTPIFPCLLQRIPFSIAWYTSFRPVLMTPSPLFLKGMNSVHAPSVSQMAMPRIAAIPRDICSDPSPNSCTDAAFLALKPSKIWLSLNLSGSPRGTTEWVLSLSGCILLQNLN